jgi:hypothetical protein
MKVRHWVPPAMKSRCHVAKVTKSHCRVHPGRQGDASILRWSRKRQSLRSKGRQGEQWSSVGTYLHDYAAAGSPCQTGYPFFSSSNISLLPITHHLAAPSAKPRLVVPSRRARRRHRDRRDQRAPRPRDRGGRARAGLDAIPVGFDGSTCRSCCRGIARVRRVLERRDSREERRNPPAGESDARSKRTIFARRRFSNAIINSRGR